VNTNPDGLRLNILLISDDQHRYDCLGVWGRFPVRTPHLDQLARDGVWHRHAYTPCALCLPARCSLHTGLYAHQHGAVTNEGHWRCDVPTLPQVLQQAGYHTAMIGKLHVFEGLPERIDLTDPAVRRQTHRLGYDDVHEVCGKAFAWYVDCDWTHDLRRHGLLDAYRTEGQRHMAGDDAREFPLPTTWYSDVYIADRAVRWLESYRDDRPFFLWVGLCSPHPPYDAPREYLERHPPGSQPLPVDHPAPEAARWPLKRRHYAAMIELVDAQVGRVLAALDARGWRERTLVVFLSDHGEMLGDHGLDGKCHPHDPSIRVPLLARCPPLITSGTVSDALVELTDVVATAVEVGTGDADATRHLPRTPGRSLLTHWRAPHTPVRDLVYTEDGGHFFPPHQTVRTESWKYSFYTRDGREALFDLRADPDECVNRAGDPAQRDVQAELRTRAFQRLAATPPPWGRDPRAGENV